MTLPDRTEEQSLRPMDSFDSGQVEEQPAKKSKAEELIQKIYSTNVPEPVFDQAKADRLKRMGRINQMGKGISVLGDMLASGLGANVNRRQDDGTAARLYQSYEQNLDKYKNDQDVYSLRKLSKSLEDARMGLSEARREEQLDFQNRKQADWMKAKEADNKLSWAKWSAEFDRKVDVDKTNAAYKDRMATASEIRASKTGFKEPKPMKPYMQVGVQNLTEGEARKLFDEAMAYYNKGTKGVGFEGTESKYLKGMLAAYTNQPEETKKEIVAHYLRDEQRQLNQARENKTESTVPASQPKTQVKSNPFDF